MSTQMQMGAQVAYSGFTPPEFIAESAKMLENKGFDSLWVPEYVLFFEDYASSYPYSDNGRIPGDPKGILDPFTALTFLASHTQRVRLGTGICLVPQRQPVYTAKMVADVDFLSGGRVDFGVGVGWLREEFDNLQVPWARRGPRTSEYIRVMQALWTQDVASYSSEEYQLTPCLFNPKPIQKPHPPVIFGGESEAALRRVATLGQGWFGYNQSPQGVQDCLKRLDTLLAEQGRSRDELRIMTGPNSHPVTPDTIKAYADCGVEQVMVPVMAGNLDKLERRADKMLEMREAA